MKINPVLLPLTGEESRLVRMLKALGNPVRFQLVRVLAEKKVCITGELVEFTNLAQSTVSQHLKVLREAGLVDGEVDGPATCYCLNETNLAWLKEQIISLPPAVIVGNLTGEGTCGVGGADFSG
jgi:ArsR family transcriptional regulator